MIKKLLMIPSVTSKIPIFKPSPKNLQLKSSYFINSQKNPNEDNKKQKKQQQSINQKNEKPRKLFTGPKILLNNLKSGKIKMIPFYLRSLSIYLYPQKKKLKQSPIQPTQKKPNTFKKSKMPAILFRQRLFKKYKIVQALKATNKILDSEYMKHALNYIDIIGYTRRHYTLKDMAKSPYALFFYFNIFLIFAVDYLIDFEENLVLDHQTLNQKSRELNQNQIQNRLNQIKQIRIRQKTNGLYTLMLVLKQQRKLDFINEFFFMLGAPIQKHKTQLFQCQNPNLIIDGLQKIQQNKQQKDWIKIIPLVQKYSFSSALYDTLMLMTPFIGIFITYYIFRRVNPQQMMSNLTSKKKSMKIESLKDIKVRFKDVAGMDGAKKEITQFVDFLKKSQKYVEMGAKIPKGALLTGPPGTGKTMLAKACAGEAGTSFFYVSGSEFVEMFVGLGASRVRQLFDRARKQAPSIIFIDQIDAIGKKRETSRNEQKDSTLNQLLVEMDGFSSSETVIVLAATNRKDVLDSALTRPGRFDRMVQVTLPQIKAREEIFMVHLAPLKINPNRPTAQIAKRLAQLTPGFSGADIANLCNQAAIIATRKQRTHIQDADFQQASQRIMAGYVKKGLSNVKTRKRVAYHEAGHAVCGWYLRGGDPLVKLTIIPRSKGALGYAQYLPKTAYIRTKSDLIDQVSIMLGGTTSEQIFLGNMSSGNSDDLQKVYSLARRMITQFGMGETTYNLTIDEQTYVKKQSEKLCDTMDQEILQLVEEASLRAKNIINSKRDIVEKLAEQLLVKETINSEDIVRIMGQRAAFV